MNISDLSTFNTLVVFILIIVPGFITLKIYTLFYPARSDDYSTKIIELGAYGIINLAITFYPLYLINSYGWQNNHQIWFFLFILTSCFIIPCLTAFIIRAIRQCERITKYFTHPSPSPWDYVFSKREPYWIILHMKDGTKIGGVFSKESMASCFPEQNQIYIEQLWTLNDKGVLKV